MAENVKIKKLDSAAEIIKVKRIMLAVNSKLSLADVISDTSKRGVFEGRVNLHCGYCNNDTSEKISDLPARGEIHINCENCGRTFEREYGIKRGIEIVYLTDIKRVIKPDSTEALLDFYS